MSVEYEGLVRSAASQHPSPYMGGGGERGGGLREEAPLSGFWKAPNVGKYESASDRGVAVKLQAP